MKFEINPIATSNAVLNSGIRVKIINGLKRFPVLQAIAMALLFVSNLYVLNSILIKYESEEEKAFILERAYALAKNAGVDVFNYLAERGASYDAIEFYNPDATQPLSLDLVSALAVNQAHWFERTCYVCNFKTIKEKSLVRTIAEKEKQFNKNFTKFC